MPLTSALHCWRMFRSCKGIHKNAVYQCIFGVCAGQRRRAPKCRNHSAGPACCCSFLARQSPHCSKQARLLVKLSALQSNAAGAAVDQWQHSTWLDDLVRHHEKPTLIFAGSQPSSVELILQVCHLASMAWAAKSDEKLSTGCVETACTAAAA